ncbi:MAG: hypothetical protein COU31_02965 [Candidatus Magasanikbacteria bacterium CG10_big_fil_rev_8_21_14_0_10_40_10]|uniref:Uncharacterized protein n=1 Tax=Candidatus Magasanikbacteria bacterium CG10_big_fil_rev_8_21_14_0_10_40_10 TaxID=1974648 RepID=A0A2M6W3Q7_9BACT|nr:MAG: hypothetical protein COU31_02965 [Candidatus Magasanikbacteria bacterium CG10_big_fil_rev_8_21_14_0_10_40_10]
MPLKNKKEENILDNNPNFSVEKSNDVKDVDFLASASESEKIVEKKENEADLADKAKQSKTESGQLKKLILIKKKTSTIPAVRDELTLKIEKILEEGLNDSFQQLSPIAKQEFKIKGEEIALKIRDLLRSTHIKAKKILKLILEWLRFLPGINRFFIEQEAKIKADRIINLKL